MAAAVVAVVLIVVAVDSVPGGSGGAPAGPPAPPSGTEFGANVNRLFNDRLYTAREIDAQLQALRATGVTVARSDTLWEVAEPAPPAGGVHRYDWTFDDQIAGALAAQGLRWLPIVDYAPAWATTDPGRQHSAPRDLAAYAAFAAAFAARYGRGGAFWREHPELPAMSVGTYELWNEPDGAGFWAPAGDPRRYAELYVRARMAIRAADPAARAIVGGLSSTVFVAAMLAARPQLRHAIDGVAIHPYGADPDLVLAAIRTARETLIKLGLGAVPLYATEFGWTTRPRAGGTAPRLRPGYISTTLALLGHIDCGLSGAYIYTWVTPERSAANGEDWFGIHPPRGGSSADAAAFARGLRLARAGAPTVSLCGAR